jgi:hypothetical protein
VAAGRVLEVDVSHEGSVHTHPPAANNYTDTRRVVPKWPRGCGRQSDDERYFSTLPTPPRRIHSSRRIQCLQQARQQRRLAQHLRDIEAARIRNGEPRRSIRLLFRYDPAFRYIIFGEEGYVNPNDLFEREDFPSFGWRIDRRHLQNLQLGGDDATE